MGMFDCLFKPDPVQELMLLDLAAKFRKMASDDYVFKWCPFNKEECSGECCMKYENGKCTMNIKEN